MKFINKISDFQENLPTNISMYDSQGRESNDIVLAVTKVVSTSGVPKFSILSSKRQRRLFNPSVDSLSEKNIIKTEPEFKFEEVNKSCYDSYVEYLRTRNSYSLTTATMHYKR